MTIVHVKFEDKPEINTIALRKAKIVYNFGLSECSRVIILMLLIPR